MSASLSCLKYDLTFPYRHNDNRFGSSIRRSFEGWAAINALNESQEHQERPGRKIEVSLTIPNVLRRNMISLPLQNND